MSCIQAQEKIQIQVQEKIYQAVIFGRIFFLGGQGGRAMKHVGILVP